MNAVATTAATPRRWREFAPLLPLWLVLLLLPFGRSAEAGTALCMLGALYLCVVQRRTLLARPGMVLLLMLFAAYAGAALLSAPDAEVPGKSWSTCAALLRFALLGVYAVVVVHDVARLRVLYLATAVLVVLWALDAWMQALAGWSLGGAADPERITGIFGAGNPKLGPVLAALSPFALWAVRERWGRTALVAVFLFLLVPILLAGERQAWLCYALVAVAFAWRESGAPLRFIGWLAGAAIVVAVAMGAAWQWSPRFEARMARSVQAFDGSLAAVNFAGSGRLDIWRTAWRMFEAHPVNGVGVRDFRYAYPHFAPADDHFLTQENCGVGAGACHPHQLLLEIASETGVVGLALWFAGFVLALRAWRRAGSAARRAAFPATVAVATTLFPLNTHLAFYSAWWGLLFWWLLVVWCAALFAESGVHADPELAVHVSSRRPA